MQELKAGVTDAAVEKMVYTVERQSYVLYCCRRDKTSNAISLVDH